MNRITDKVLQAVVDRLNRTMNRPTAPYAKDATGRLVGQIGNYHLEHSYGGVNLGEIMNEGGGTRSPLGLGSRPKRELYDQLHAFLNGIEAAKAA